jgi:hypothetical protein
LPFESVIAVRVCSISAGLAASTVTPGSTAPLGSFTAPAILPWARASRDNINRLARAVNPTTRILRIEFLP